jgi:hypothetical protein
MALSFWPLASLISGCVSTRPYKLAGDDVPAAVPLELVAVAERFQLTVHTVIVYRGPGSWKHEAWWDEYVVSLANLGPDPVTVESAVLTDWQGERLRPGTDPWALQRQSQQWWKQVGRQNTSTPVQLGASPVLKAGGYALATTASVAGGAAVAMGATVSTGGLVLLAWPAYALGSVAVNRSNQGKVAAEFSRRRLALPVNLPTESVAQGSLFFRLAPGPQRLVLRITRAERVEEVGLELTPLATLHLAVPAEPAAVP